VNCTGWAGSVKPRYYLTPPTSNEITQIVLSALGLERSEASHLSLPCPASPPTSAVLTRIAVLAGTKAKHLQKVSEERSVFNSGRADASAREAGWINRHSACMQGAARRKACEGSSVETSARQTWVSLFRGVVSKILSCANLTCPDFLYQT
jgi:hypothetical protein